MKQKELLLRVIDALPEGILCCDEQLIVRVINKYYAGLLGHDPGQILGGYLPDFIPDTRAARVIKSGKAELADLCALPLFGKKNRFVVNRLPIRDDSGKVTGMLSHIVFADPDELQKLNSKIESLSRKLNFYKSSIESILKSRYDIDRIVGNSLPMQQLKNVIRAYARQEHAVLILGETGTGKELTAHALHAESDRAKGPFISINCAAIPGELFEAELFGYAPGAFSGAHKDGKIGQLELADKGTLFLDEIGDVPLHAQVKLLRVLEEKRVTRVGAVTGKDIDFRLITATNKDFRSMIADGAFREDLYYRISTLTINLPPLAERHGDIPLLSRNILGQIGSRHLSLSSNALKAMEAYSWPGNIRQLYNTLVHASIHCSGNVIDAPDLPGEITGGIYERTAGSLAPTPPQLPADLSGEPGKLATHMASHEAELLRGLLARNKGNISATARQLGISRVTLYGKLRRYGLQKEPRA